MTNPLQIIKDVFVQKIMREKNAREYMMMNLFSVTFLKKLPMHCITQIEKLSMNMHIDNLSEKSYSLFANMIEL